MRSLPMELPPQAYRPPLEPGAPPRLPVRASLRRRAWALVVDDLLVGGPLLAAALWTRFGDTQDAGDITILVLLAAAFVWAPVAWFLNRLFLTSRTGRSVGKALLGIRIVYIPTWEPPTMGQLWDREIKHEADFTLFSDGWSRVDDHWLGQTYADELARTAVVLPNPPVR